MISYDSQQCGTFLRLRGSVLPSAAGFGFVSGMLSLLLYWADKEGILSAHDTIKNNAAFTLYTSTLLFLLLFRTRECYNRFWHCATSMCTFRTQLLEAAKSLITFTEMSKSTEEDIDHFNRSIATFTSLLHATALGNVSGLELNKFHVVDMEAIPQHMIDKLESYSSRNKVDLVYMWLNNVIIRGVKSGLLNVPPPILSRVFQQTEKAFVEYNQVLEVMTIPFPFPYAQTAYALLILMGLSTPFAMCSWTAHPATAFTMTFIGVMCLTSLELIARQLENPFGEDSNDLPIDDFQEAINESLVLMLTEDARSLPQLSFASLTEHRGGGLLASGSLLRKVVQGSVSQDCIKCISPSAFLVNAQVTPSDEALQKAERGGN